MERSTRILAVFAVVVTLGCFAIGAWVFKWQGINYEGLPDAGSVPSWPP
jgi:hypothetical protein